MKMQGTQQSNTILKNKVGLTYPDFKSYQKGTAIMKVQYWHVENYIDQWNKIDSLEANF